ncbi:MAG: nucleotidyltransferase domain-containing protein [Clostridia bacterium]|jgi:predicted nucleotidyltransferase|nr:nucleotidyltransferase domain-containing protein [Clostridiaceae bacterium]
MVKRTHDDLSKQLNLLTETIINTVPVRKIFLFGSYAKGTNRDDSDIDLYIIISDNIEIREIDVMKKIRKAIRDKKTKPVDIIVSKENNFYRRTTYPTIEQQVIKDGKLLYG